MAKARTERRVRQLEMQIEQALMLIDGLAWIIEHKLHVEPAIVERAYDFAVGERMMGDNWDLSRRAVA